MLHIEEKSTNHIPFVYFIPDACPQAVCVKGYSWGPELKYAGETVDSYEKIWLIDSLIKSAKPLLIITNYGNNYYALMTKTTAMALSYWQRQQRQSLFSLHIKYAAFTSKVIYSGFVLESSVKLIHIQQLPCPFATAGQENWVIFGLWPDVSTWDPG